VLQLEETKKYIICGDSNVGKTAIVERLTNNCYQGNYRITLGTNVSLKSNKYIFDIAGYCLKHDCGSTFICGASAALVVYDPMLPESFNNIKLWVNKIRQYTEGNIPMILIANKSDLKTCEISPEQGKLKAEELGFTHFLETSAKTGHNILKAFSMLSDA
jgi:small GTP-binding protein